MTLLYIFGFIVVVFILPVIVITIRESKKLQAARKEYDELYIKYGYSAREHCPHKVLEITLADMGVVTFTNKWCKVCKKDLGPAKLKKSFIFGNRWE